MNELEFDIQRFGHEGEDMRPVYFTGPNDEVCYFRIWNTHTPAGVSSKFIKMGGGVYNT